MEPRTPDALGPTQAQRSLLRRQNPPKTPKPHSLALTTTTGNPQVPHRPSDTPPLWWAIPSRPTARATYLHCGGPRLLGCPLPRHLAGHAAALLSHALFGWAAPPRRAMSITR